MNKKVKNHQQNSNLNDYHCWRFDDACKNGYLDAIETMVNEGFDIYQLKAKISFFSCISSSNIEVIKFLLTSQKLKKHFNLNDKNDKNITVLEMIFAYVHKRELLALVKFLFNHPITKNQVNIHQHPKLLPISAERGMIELVQYLLTSPDLKEHPNIDAGENFYNPLICAIKGNKFKIVQYLLTSPELPVHADIDYNNGLALECAGEQDNMKILKYLLTSSELKKKANIHIKNNLLVVVASIKLVTYNNIDRSEAFKKLKFLLTSPKLKEHADYNVLNENNCDAEVLKWIHEYIIPLSQKKQLIVESKKLKRGKKTLL